jgi:hypothetical protein
VAEEFVKAIYLWTVWDTYTDKGQRASEFALLVQEIVRGPQLSVETFDEFWNILTFHGFSGNCEQTVQRMSAEEILRIRSMLTDEAAEWIDYGLSRQTG